ncbi:aminoacyl-tRNA hydrolase [Hyphococcus sp. DH-69]|uniref:aminoacyl-tRNA hydrolase n=1 Tax=Hyphococcus formosus TaxID=3143534 RepID=UPI00398B77C8
MLLLVGLGNPGEKHARQRHNVGFMAVDEIANAHNFSVAKSKFHGEIREGFLDGPNGRSKALILKPLTYMNESGRSVGEAARFFKIPNENIIVFYDELDLAPGKLRIKTGGGAAGHNGIRSIDAHIGNDFKRVRIGIGHPGSKSRVTGHVLGDFAKADQDWLQGMLRVIAKSAPMLTTGDGNRFATAVAQEFAPAKPPAKQEKTKQKPAETSKPVTQSNEPDKTETNAFAAAFQKILGGKK